jgi:hypothetical protein
VANYLIYHYVLINRQGWGLAPRERKPGWVKLHVLSKMLKTVRFLTRGGFSLPKVETYAKRN